MLGVLGVTCPVIGNSRATGERHASVDNQRLAMGAMIEAPDGVPTDRVKPGDLALARLQRLQDLLADSGRSDGIEKQFYFDAGAAFPSERIRKLLADFAGPVNVCLNRNGVLGLLDGVQHSRI